MNQQNKFDKEVVSLLDIIGSSVVDNFYNHLYDKAIAIKERTNKSITESYRLTIINYIKDHDSPIFYKKLIESIQFYTKMATCYDDISYIQCINLYSKLFIPDQYFMSMTENQKNNLLFMVLKASINTFTQHILSSYISIIIDDHMNSENVVILQNVFLEILLAQRDESYSKFIKVEQSTGGKGVKISTKKNKHKDQIMIKLTKKYKKCIDDYNKLKRKYEDIKSKYNDLQLKGKEMQELFLNQLNDYKSATNEIEHLKKHIMSSKPKKVEFVNSIEDDEESKEDKISKNNDYSTEFSFSILEEPNYIDDDA